MGGPGANGRILPPVTGSDTLPQTPHRAGALCIGYALFKNIRSALVYYLVLFHTYCITLAVVIIEKFSCPAV